MNDLVKALRQIANTAEFPSDEAHQDCVDIAKEALAPGKRDLFTELKEGLEEIRDHPEQLKRTER